MNATKDSNGISEQGQRATKSDRRDERADRLAAALRANLKKRKAQARERAQKAPDPADAQKKNPADNPNESGSRLKVFK